MSIHNNIRLPKHDHYNQRGAARTISSVTTEKAPFYSRRREALERAQTSTYDPYVTEYMASFAGSRAAAAAAVAAATAVTTGRSGESTVRRRREQETLEQEKNLVKEKKKYTVRPTNQYPNTVRLFLY